VVHLRIVVPESKAEGALRLLDERVSVVNIIHLRGVATKPVGDVILCDVVREDASLVIDALSELDITSEGSVSLQEVESEISEAGDHAEDVTEGHGVDAVVWEEVEESTSEEAQLSVSFLLFMTLAMLIAMVGIIVDQPVLIIGAMVVGPEFGPLAGFCVALVEGRRGLAGRSAAALALGFASGMMVTLIVALGLRWAGLAPSDLAARPHPLTAFISDPDFYSFLVALLAGIAGVLSLTSRKSGALVGVLISVTTIPSAANVGLAAAYADGVELRGAALQLIINLTTLCLAGTATLYVQRRLFEARRRRVNAQGHS
jgi:uncharacterized hydrophobic protein (TIGR00271 family)